MSWGQWGAWQVHPRVVVGWDGRSSIGPAAGGEECREKEAKGRKAAEQRENEMRWLEESGRELGLGIALICDEAACWISGWQTLICGLVVTGQSVYSSKKTIFLVEDFLLCRESLQATKKFFLFLFFLLLFLCPCNCLFAVVFFYFLSIVLFLPCLLPALHVVSWNQQWRLHWNTQARQMRLCSLQSFLSERLMDMCKWGKIEKLLWLCATDFLRNWATKTLASGNTGWTMDGRVMDLDI